MFTVLPAELGRLDAAALESLVARNELTVVIGDGVCSGVAAAALLFADYSVIREGAALEIDGAEAWAGAAWRLGRRAYRVYLGGTARFDSRAALEAGLCDEVTTLDAQRWLEGWMGNRSALALDSAAVLIRGRGSDRLERAEFARLFALGEPQKGLRAFLTR